MELKIRLIIRYSHGIYDTHTKVTNPIIYESKEQFLADFEDTWKKCQPKDIYDSVKFTVGEYEFWHEEHRSIGWKVADQGYWTCQDPGNYSYLIELPEVLTIDEFFEEM